MDAKLIPGLSSFIHDFSIGLNFGDALTPPEPNVVALNRITYGATAADIESVRSKGLNAFIDQQPHRLVLR